MAIGGSVFGDDEHGMDQLWWDFTGGAPRCVAEYVDAPITDEQTGAVVEVAGNAFVRLRCSPVHALALTTVDPRVEPPRFPEQLGRYRLSGDWGFPAGRNMVEVVQTGWGGGVLTVTVGLRHRAPLGIAWVGGDGPSATGGGDVQGAWLVVMQ